MVSLHGRKERVAMEARKDGEREEVEEHGAGGQTGPSSQSLEAKSRNLIFVLKVLKCVGRCQAKGTLKSPAFCSAGLGREGEDGNRH